MITTNEILVLIHFTNQQGEKISVIYLPNEGSKHRRHCLLFLGRKISLLSRVETQGWHHL